MYRLFITIILSCIACGGNKPVNAPIHHGAFFRTQWESLETASTDKKSDDAKKTTADQPPIAKESHNADSIRQQVAAAAKTLLQSENRSDDFGAIDVQTVFSNVGLAACIAKDTDVPLIVKAATTQNAYGTQAQPQIGDLILFHNQYDRNRNGESDDWFTGIGIVVERERKTVTAVTRTGMKAKEIRLSPKGPMVHIHREKIVNSFVKIPTPHDPKDAQYLAGQLYAGFINLDPFIDHCRK